MSKILDYLEQPDQFTCQSAAIAKVLGTEDVYGVRAALTAGGRIAGDPANMGEYLAPRVKEYRYTDKGSLIQIENWVTQGPGYEVIVHGNTTRAGHVWGISDADPKNRVFVVDDPWYEYDFPRARFTTQTGKNCLYSYRAIWAYCVASWSWEQAAELYASGSVDSNEPGAWVHFIRN